VGSKLTGLTAKEAGNFCKVSVEGSIPSRSTKFYTPTGYDPLKLDCEKVHEEKNLFNTSNLTKPDGTIYKKRVISFSSEMS